MLQWQPGQSVEVLPAWARGAGSDPASSSPSAEPEAGGLHAAAEPAAHRRLRAARRRAVRVNPAVQAAAGHVDAPGAAAGRERVRHRLARRAARADRGAAPVVPHQLGAHARRLAPRRAARRRRLRDGVVVRDAGAAGLAGRPHEAGRHPDRGRRPGPRQDAVRQGPRARAPHHRAALRHRHARRAGRDFGRRADRAAAVLGQRLHQRPGLDFVVDGRVEGDRSTDG